MERFGTISFSDKEHERVPGESIEYYYEHEYWLEIVFNEDCLYDGDEFLGIKPLLDVFARHSKVYKRDGKLLSEDLIDEVIEFTIDDPGSYRLHEVTQKLNEYVKDHTWLRRIFALF